MSITIYNGLRINAGGALANLKVLNEIREPVQRLVNLKMAKLMAERLAGAIDHHIILRDQLSCAKTPEDVQLPSDWATRQTECVRWYVERAIRLAQKECRAGQERNPLEDCDVELFLRALPTSGVLLGYLQEERVGAHSLLLATAGIEDYGYWNNSDPPDEVTARAWRARKAAWAKTEGLTCFSVRWEPDYDVTQELIISQLATHESRVVRRARDEMQRVAIQAQLDKEKAAGDTSASFVGISQVLHEITTAIDTEGSPEREEYLSLMQKYRKLLPVDVVPLLHEEFKDLP